jgi:hypothetical protein
MRVRTRYLATLLLGAGLSASVVAAPAALAAPQCTNTGPNTTVCETNGSSQITTSPPQQNFVNPYWGGFGLGWGGIVIGLG